MELRTVSVKDIHPYEKNPRKNDDAVAAVKESIKQCGYVAPIIVDENMVVLAGHTRLKAVKSLGYKEVQVGIASGLNEEQKRKYRILDNKTNEFAEWDLDLLAKELEELDFEGFDFGFDTEDEIKEKKENTSVKGSLRQRFVIPPFSVFDTRKGEWQERKREWREIIQDDGTTRGDAEVFQGHLDMYDGVPEMSDVSILDPVMAEVLTKWFMPLEREGVNCFDVFAGDTVFGFVSSYLGKKFTGIELRKEQAEFNQQQCERERLNATYICDDGRNVCKHIGENTQDFFFSCPPYYDLEVYSNLENDASNQETYEEFYKILDTAFTEASKCLKNDRFACVVASDVRGKDGGYYNFVSDIKKTFLNNGFKIYNEIVLVNPVGTGALRANRTMHTRKTVRMHQEVLVFYKGKQENIKKLFGEIEVADIESEDE